MSSENKQIQTFGPFTLDRTEARLTREGSPVSLPPKVFELLCYLAANAGRLIEKDELLKALWPDSFVEEANLTVGIAALRKALGAELIETVPKPGYRFTGEVRIAVADSPSRVHRYWGIAAVLVLVGLASLFMFRRAQRTTGS